MLRTSTPTVSSSGSRRAPISTPAELFAEVVMEPSTQEMYSKITGSIPARTDVNLAAEALRRPAQLGAEFA